MIWNLGLMQKFLILLCSLILTKSVGTFASTQSKLIFLEPSSSKAAELPSTELPATVSTEAPPEPPKSPPVEQATELSATVSTEAPPEPPKNPSVEQTTELLTFKIPQPQQTNATELSI